MTLEMAILHKDVLNQAYAEHAHDPRWRWYHGAYSILEKEIGKDTWGKVQMVSVKDRELLGYLSAGLSRERQLVDSLSMVRFGTRMTVEYGRDMARFLRLLFDHYAVFGIGWTVVIGSPHERTYDLLAQRLGGRVVGVMTGDAVLHDGTRHDRKLYEVLAENLNRRALARLAGEKHGTQGQALARGRGEARSQQGHDGTGPGGDPEALEGSPSGGGRPLQPEHGRADSGVGGLASDSFHRALGAMRALGNFGARVTDSGGGKVELLVDRDTLFYPAVGTHVEVIAGDPRIKLTPPRYEE